MEIRKDHDVVVIKLLSADLSEPRNTSRVIEALLKNDGERKIVLDLSQIEGIYSLQIGTLVTIHCLCYENVAVMKLTGANDRVKELLRMVGLETLMALHHGADIAIESFGAPPAHQQQNASLPEAIPSNAKGSIRPADPRVKR